VIKAPFNKIGAHFYTCVLESHFVVDSASLSSLVHVPLLSSKGKCYSSPRVMLIWRRQIAAAGGGGLSAIVVYKGLGKITMVAPSERSHKLFPCLQLDDNIQAGKYKKVEYAVATMCDSL